MKKKSVLKSAVFVALCMFGLGAFCDEAFPQAVRITTIKNYGKSLDWSHTNNKILSARRGVDGFFDVFVMDPDGTNEVNLTRRKAGCPQRHNGNPAWHPSAEYIVFTAQKENIELTPEVKELGVPGTGFNCDLWAMAADGETFYQLTDLPLYPVHAVIHPQFSHDGKKLTWAERIGRSEDTWGRWVLKVADFLIEQGVPALRNIKTYELGANPCFYETHAFSKDDTKVLFCANLEKDHAVTGLDIYELDLISGAVKRLTQTLGDWDEHAHYSPDGTHIAWMSSTGFDIAWGDISGHKWQKQLMTELWIMDTDGSNKRQLTHFNTPGYPEYMGGARCVISDSSFSPDGKSIVALLAYEEAQKRLRTKIIMIKL